jgi:flagellin
MALVIYNNIYSVVAQNRLATANSAIAKSIERLSSGLRINHASDDASGLAISEKLRAQIRGLAKASLNAQDATSFLQTAEGGMEVISDMLQRMRELAVQAGNGTYTSNDRKELQKEVDQLKAEINRISASTEYNTKKLLTGDAAALWSANTADIEAIVRGAPAEGNYQISVSKYGGRAAEYKSDIMTYAKDTALALAGYGATKVTGLEFTGDKSLIDSATVTLSAAGATAGANIAAGYFRALTGTSTLVDTTLVATGAANFKGGYVLIEILENKTLAAATDTVQAQVTFIGPEGTETQTVSLSQATATAITFAGAGSISIAGVGNATLVAGDKSLEGVNAIGITGLKGKIGAGPWITVSGQDSLIIGSLSTGGTLRTASLLLEHAEDKAAGSFKVNVKDEGDPAYTTTKLKDLTLFTNADGRMVLDNTQELTIYANDKSAKITIEGNDTINDFVLKFNEAAEELGLGPNIMAFGNYPGTTFEGVFHFKSNKLVGSQSEIKLVGDENIINALSIIEVKSAKNADITATVLNAHTGAVVGKDTVSDYVLRGIIDGVDVKFDASIANGAYYLHVVDNRTEVQVGANEGQTFDVSIGRIDTTSLEINDAYVVTMADSQKAITKFDQALEKVSSARATIGAQINRLEYTIKNLSISRENLISAESRIRDLDVAEESATFAKNQILVNSAVAMLAQANTLPQIALQLLQ